MFRPIMKYRPAISSVTLSIIVALYMLVVFNRTFWQHVFKAFNYDFAPITAIAVGVACLFIALTVTVSVKYLIKPVFIIFILAGSVASWFTDEFGTIIDRDMIANAVETTPAEASNLLSPMFFSHLFLTGVLPCLLILWVKVKHFPILKKVLFNLSVIVPCLLIAVFCTLITSRQLISTLREHNEIVRIVNPILPIGNAVKYVVRREHAKTHVFKQVGLDAKVVPLEPQNHRPRVIVVVAGETARAEDFSLQGYDKETNPELKKRDIIYFPNTTSCGTATAQSLPCMFSPYPRKEFTIARAVSTNSLPDILQNAGVNVEWWENNTGSKGVADRVKTVSFYGSKNPTFCIDGECQDGIMLKQLGEWLDHIDHDSVLFVHQLGSHGPAYFERYPETFRHFRPDCRNTVFSECKPEEIRNAYDNTILYTDYFLSAIIDALNERAGKFDSAMFYMSDHGESLGENGLYLHGMPYSIAPKEQTHIPFILWISPAFANTMKLDLGCVKKDADIRQMSHDNLFPSVLTMMNVKTTLKDDRLDIFKSCQASQVAMEK